MASAQQHVVVVGAGIVGASIAWHLAAQHGVRVTVVASDVGGQATPNSFAWLNANASNPRFYYDVRHRSLARWHALADEVPGLAALVRWSGNVQWDRSPTDLAAFERQHASWGYSIDRIDTADIAAREPWLSDAVLPEHGWGLLLDEEGSVEPADAARLLLKHARTAHGVKVVDATVETLLVTDGTVTGVATSSGDSITADHVILAAGLGTVPLSAAVGITVPISGRPGLLVHSKPVSARLLNGIVISGGPHMRQTVAGRIVSGANFAGSDPGKDPQAEADALFAKVQAAFRPALADGTPLPPLELDFYTIGNRPDPQDGFPILGPSGKPGLTLAVMHSGVTLAAFVGETLAALVVTGKKDPALDSFALTRFDKA